MEIGTQDVLRDMAPPNAQQDFRPPARKTLGDAARQFVSKWPWPRCFCSQSPCFSTPEVAGNLFLLRFTVWHGGRSHLHTFCRHRAHSRSKMCSSVCFSPLASMWAHGGGLGEQSSHYRGPQVTEGGPERVGENGVSFRGLSSSDISTN